MELFAMRKGQILGILAALTISQAACQKEKPQDAAVEAEAVKDTNSNPTPAAKDQVADNQPPPTCTALNIPSYDLWIKDLSALRCDECHNETFAWDGIILTQYEGYTMYTKAIRNRIFYNLLTKPLEPGEQEMFLTWIDNGLPRTENDCTGPRQ
jgi:hypothetical protein